MAKASEIKIRCTDSEKERWSEAAEVSGDSLSNWIRDALDAQAEFQQKDPEAVAQERREAGFSARGAKPKVVRVSGCPIYTPRGVKCKACGRVHP